MLTPFRVDTNSLLITERLNAIGYDVRLKAVVADEVDELAEIIRAAMAWADLIMVTGGLGPTEDDITRDAVARTLDTPLDVDEAIADRIRDRFARRGMTMPEINRRQAMVPRGADVLENPNGTAPGLWIERGRTAIVLLPGPPREMRPMLEGVIRDRLAPRSGTAGLFRRVLKITGRAESDVDAQVQPVYAKWTAQPVPISTTILAVLGQIELHLSAQAPSLQAADTVLDVAVLELQAVLGPSIYSTDGRSLEAVVADRGTWRGQRIGGACDGRGDPDAGRDQRRHRDYGHRRPRRRLTREASGHGRRRRDPRRRGACAHVSVLRRPRHGEVSGSSGGVEHDAAGSHTRPGTPRMG